MANTYVIIYIVSILGLAIIVAIVTFYCMCKKKVKKGRVIRPQQPPQVIVRPNDSPSRYEASVSNSDVYIVPFNALPANFDYSAQGVEVRGDFVILKNMSLLDQNTNYEAFRQSPYNPNVHNPYNQQNINQYNAGNPPPYTPGLYPNVTGEAYQKQAAYNPDYVNQ